MSKVPFRLSNLHGQVGRTGEFTSKSFRGFPFTRLVVIIILAVVADTFFLLPGLPAAAALALERDGDAS